jgi:hypothetical protein
MSMRRAVPALLAGALVACGRKHPPLIGDAPLVRDAGSDGAAYFDESPKPPPPPDAPGYCGNVIIPAIVDRPNLYFVLDASGSMGQDMPQPSAGTAFLLTRYNAAVGAIVGMLRKVGHRVSYGAAVFPSQGDGGLGVCPPGQEVFETEPGDPVSYAEKGKMGPILNGLMTTLLNHRPSGLTPTAATLLGLEPKLRALPGKTYVFLLTDGAPNCDAAASCGTDKCTVNIEGDCDPAHPALNCCDPLYAVDANLWCLDDDPTVEAVAKLANDGISTYVLGMQVPLAYANVLDRLAVAGNTARAASPYYYPVDDADALTSALNGIGTSVSISCDIQLSAPPPDPKLVNVYFGQTVVPLDAANGWTWLAPDHIGIVGDSCTKLRQGDVLDVQVVSGCPSVVN